VTFKILPGLLYAKTDEWIRIEGNEGVIGISDYAQDALSDIVYVELPNVGDTFDAGTAFRCRRVRQSRL
jgi:glycine cleavage system H protein